MDVICLDKSELPFALRALHNVLASNRSVTIAEQRFLQVISHLHGMPIVVEAMRPIELTEVARGIPRAHARKRVVQLAVIAAMVEGDVSNAESEAVSALAGALEVDEGSLKVLRDLAANQHLLARFDMMRRIMGRFAGQAYDEEGLDGVHKLLALFGVGKDDPDLAWKYKQLGLLPAGTLGREFWEHCTSRRFGFPGEPGGIPERLVFHDFGHVLAGYDTDPAGEIQQGAFQAGFMREDGFAFLMFAVIQFHLGIQITPVAQGEVDLLDVKKLLHAAQRGAACKVDLSDRWDPFAVAHRPVAELRAAYAIPPLQA